MIIQYICIQTYSDEEITVFVINVFTIKVQKYCKGAITTILRPCAYVGASQPGWQVHMLLVITQSSCPLKLLVSEQSAKQVTEVTH